MIEDVLIYGTVQGSVLALLALGFSLVYGVGGVLNLAHGGFYLISCYTLYWMLASFNQFVSIIITLITISVIGALTYLALIKPMLESHIRVLIGTFSLAFFFEQFVKVGIPRLLPSDPRTHFLPPIVEDPASLWGVTYPGQFNMTMIGAIILVSIIALFITKTKIGKSIRAVSQDREAAQLMGINADLVLMITVILSAFLTGMAAVLYASGRTISPTMGWSFLIDAFAITVIGGMGSITGSILGAYILGYTKVFFSNLISPTFSVLIPLIALIVILLFRPRGLFGKKEVK